MLARGVRTLLIAATIAAPGALPGQEEEPEAPRVRIPVFVEIHNNNWLDMRVYLISNLGGRQLLGTVTSYQQALFQLPIGMVLAAEPVRFTADPVGSRHQFGTQPVLVSGGDLVEWRIENNPDLSTVRVRSIL